MQNSNHWRFFGLIYFNPQDSRIFVTKKIEWMGVTLNFGNPKTYPVLFAIVLFFGFIVYRCK